MGWDITGFKRPCAYICFLAPVISRLACLRDIFSRGYHGNGVYILITISLTVYTHIICPLTTHISQILKHNISKHMYEILSRTLMLSRKARQVIVMHRRPPFVYMYVYMYIRLSQPETPRLRNSLVFSAGAHDNKTLYLTTISHETAQHSTLTLHAAFRLLLTLSIASARATRLLVILPYWLTSFAPRGQEHFHCSLG